MSHQYTDVTRPSQVREELRESAAAALALGLPLKEFRIRELTVLHIDGRIFEPHRKLADALKLLFFAQRLGINGSPLCVRVVTSCEDTRVQIDAGPWHAVDYDACMDGEAIRAAILSAFVAEYNGAP